MLSRVEYIHSPGYAILTFFKIRIEDFSVIKHCTYFFSFVISKVSYLHRGVN